MNVRPGNLTAADRAKLNLWGSGTGRRQRDDESAAAQPPPPPQEYTSGWVDCEHLKFPCGANRMGGFGVSLEDPNIHSAMLTGCGSTLGETEGRVIVSGKPTSWIRTKCRWKKIREQQFNEDGTPKLDSQGKPMQVTKVVCDKCEVCGRKYEDVRQVKPNPDTVPEAGGAARAQ